MEIDGEDLHRRLSEGSRVRDGHPPRVGNRPAGVSTPGGGGRYIHEGKIEVEG